MYRIQIVGSDGKVCAESDVRLDLKGASGKGSFKSGTLHLPYNGKVYSGNWNSFGPRDGAEIASKAVESYLATITNPALREQERKRIASLKA